MKVLGVNWADRTGSRFNGVAIRDDLLDYGVEYSLAVGLKKDLKEDWIYSALRQGSLTLKLLHLYQLIERYSGHQSRFYFFISKLRHLKAYKEADIIHFHIVHNGWFRLKTLEKIAGEKPVVWTIHDPWITTGHCVFPLGCSRHSSGCGDCPDLLSPLPVYRDKTAFAVRAKKNLIENLEVHINFSTEWFANLVGKHLELSKQNVSIVPFGIDTEQFSPSLERRTKFRNAMAIDEEDFVLLVRTNSNPQKGTTFVREALKSLKERVIVFTVDERGHLDEVSSKHTILEFGWVDSEDLLINLLNASDLFLMPSLDETFGVMALEAMACGTPVLYFQKTAVHEVVNASQDFALPKFNLAQNLYKAIKSLHSDRNKLISESTRVRESAVELHDARVYAARLSEVYRATYESRKGKNN